MPSDEEPVSEISNTIDQLNSQLSPAFDSIGKPIRIYSVLTKMVKKYFH